MIWDSIWFLSILPGLIYIAASEHPKLMVFRICFSYSVDVFSNISTFGLGDFPRHFFLIPNPENPFTKSDILATKAFRFFSTVCWCPLGQIQLGGNCIDCLQQISAHRERCRELLCCILRAVLWISSSTCILVESDIEIAVLKRPRLVKKQSHDPQAASQVLQISQAQLSQLLFLLG